jgi:superfamily I DNA/RNA helicase/RecB family exonuclease
MARLTVVTSSDPSRLLEVAAEGFLRLLKADRHDPFPTPGYLLALRQGALRDDLMRLAAQRRVRGWFDPPLCVFHELPSWLGATSRKPLGDFERASLLANAVRCAGGQILRGIRRLDHYLDAIERLFGELASEGISPEQYNAAVSAAQDDDDFAHRRNEELAAVYALYCAEMERLGFRDSRATYYDCALAVRDDPDRVERLLGGRREVRLFGLADLRGGWRALLYALAESPALDSVVVYTAQSIDFPPPLHPKSITLSDDSSKAAGLFGGRIRSEESFAVVEAPTVERELGEVARRVRQLIDSGEAPTQIAVVAREARPYLDLAVRALRRFGVPVTARRRFSYTEIPVVKALMSLFSAAADGWSRRSVIELTDQPYLATNLDSRVLSFVSSRRVISGLDRWREALAELEREARAYEEDKELHWRERPPPPAQRAAAARKAFEEFASHTGQLQRRRALAGWIDWLKQFLDSDPWHIEERVYEVPHQRFDVAKRDLTAWMGLQVIINEWSTGVERWGGGEEHIDVAEFMRRLREILAADMAVWTETLVGVQVMEALAAAYRRFDHVFLVGMEAGRFPLPVPALPVINETDRVQLRAHGVHVDLESDWDQRERDLFRVLVGGAGQSVSLSYSRINDLGQETIRSAFVDALADVARASTVSISPSEVLTPGMPLCIDLAGLRHGRQAAIIERQRETGKLTPYNGMIEYRELLAWLEEEFGDEREWSPTQLEAYAKCPWAYFSSRALRLEKLEDPAEEMEATVQGSIYHDALKRFFEAARERIGGPVFLRKGDAEWAEPLLIGALDETLDELSRTVWLGVPVLRSAKREEMARVLRRYLAWEIQFHEDMYNNRKKVAPRILRTGVIEHELKFRNLTVERSGIKVRYRGSIDRVEVGIDERVESPESYVAAVDYKASKASVPGGGDREAWDEGVVLQLPLYAHALGQLLPGGRVSRMEYRALMQHERVHALELQQIDRKTQVRYTNKEHSARMDTALDAVIDHVGRIRAGEFPAAPAPSCKCPPYCHGWEICRTAGGPQTKRKGRNR